MASKGKKGTQRKLAAILCADVAGYSRLMGADEEATIATLTAYRTVFLSQIENHNGRVVDAKGDAILAEFASVVEAVNGAVAIQQELAGKNAGLPDDRRMDFRIGINLGDVVVQDEVIYGDGVNIAARLEALAEPGGVCISGSAYEQVRKKLPLTFENLGEQAVKNIADAVLAYRIVLTTAEVDGARPGVGPATEPVPGTLAYSEIEILPPTDKPSIAVLAFDNMSGDPEQGYFSDGISEDIITDLSKISNLLVIARNASFAYRGKPVSPRQIGHELGVCYVLEGSVRKAGARVRITAQLIEAETGSHVWAERFDRALEDVFAVQDEITAEVVTALDVKLLRGEQARIWRKSLKNPQARDHYYRGLEAFDRSRNKEAVDQARMEFAEVARLEPDSPLGFVGMGLTHWYDAFRNLSNSKERSVATAADLARQALALDDNNARAHSLLGNVLLLQGNHQQALAEGLRATELGPNSADVISYYGLIRLHSGDPLPAIELVKQAMRLSPINPAWYLSILAAASVAAGDFEQAIAAARRAYGIDPGLIASRTILIRGLCRVGRLEEARALARELRRDYPHMSFQEYQRNYPYRDRAIVEQAVADLKEAGLD